METTVPSGFGGTAGQVARAAFRLGNGVNGFLILAPTFVLSFGFTLAGAPFVGQLAAQALMALFLARAAAAGLRGQLRGTVLSTDAGPWGESAQVMLRFLALSAVWLVPFFLFSLRATPDAQMQAMMMSGGAPSGPAAIAPLFGPGLGVLVALGFVSWLLPPVFLIVSVSASTFGDVFSPTHWKQQLGGRGDDVLVLYVVYAGVLLTTFAMTVPVLMLAASLSWKFAMLVGVFIGVFAAGMVFDLLGRLAGFFVVEAFAPGAPEAHVPDAHDPDAPTQGHDGPPAVDDVDGCLARAEETFRESPDIAIGMLQDLREHHAPEPRLLYALWRFLAEQKRGDEALEVAAEALPLLAADHADHAARMLKTHWRQKDRLPDDRATSLAIAHAMTDGGDLKFAANTYARVLAADKRDPRAIKGILAIAEKFHREQDHPAEAEQLYRYLLQTAPESPLAEYAKAGLAEVLEAQRTSRAG